MAELGDLAAALGVDEKDKKIEIATEMLDYKYVEDCDDTRKLKGILETPKSSCVQQWASRRWLSTQSKQEPRISLSNRSTNHR